MWARAFRPGTTGDTVPTLVRGWSTRRKVASAVVALVVVGLYAALVIFGAIDDQSQRQQPTAPGAAAETVVWISVFNVAPATQTVDAMSPWFPQQDWSTAPDDYSTT